MYSILNKDTKREIQSLNIKKGKKQNKNKKTFC